MTVQEMARDFMFINQIFGNDFRFIDESSGKKELLDCEFRLNNFIRERNISERHVYEIVRTIYIQNFLNEDYHSEMKSFWKNTFSRVIKEFARYDMKDLFASYFFSTIYNELVTMRILYRKEKLSHEDEVLEKAKIRKEVITNIEKLFSQN
jgi:hypothetical protein